LHQLGLSPRDLGRAAGPALAAYVLVLTLLVRLAPRGTTLVRRLHLPPQAESRLAGWFVPAQAVVGVLALTLSVWVCLEAPSTTERLVGPLTAALVCLACWVCAGIRPGLPGLRTGLPVPLTLGLAVVVAAEAGWALLDPEQPAPWLHRNARLLTVLTA